jgi:MoaA/NifB/PqqE/SkfB family radical SAM enzyme
MKSNNKNTKYNLKNDYRSFTHPGFVDLNIEKSVYDQKYQFFNQINHDPKAYKTCKAPWESAHINTDGDVYPCLAVKMGNIHDNSLRSIFFGEKFEHFKNDLKKLGTFPSCSRCGYLKLS